MPTNETQNQDNTVIIIVGNDAEVIDDTPDWEGLFTECDRYDGPTGHNYVRCLVCEAEILDDETPVISYRPTCRCE